MDLVAYLTHRITELEAELQAELTRLAAPYQAAIGELRRALEQTHPQQAADSAATPTPPVSEA